MDSSRVMKTFFCKNTVDPLFIFLLAVFSGNDIDSLNPSNLARMFDNHLF